MIQRMHDVTSQDAANPYSGSSLVPMLIVGLVLTLAGMIAAVGLAIFGSIACLCLTLRQFAHACGISATTSFNNPC